MVKKKPNTWGGKAKICYLVKSRYCLNMHERVGCGRTEPNLLYRTIGRNARIVHRIYDDVFQQHNQVRLFPPLSNNITFKKSTISEQARQQFQQQKHATIFLYYQNKATQILLPFTILHF